MSAKLVFFFFFFLSLLVFSVERKPSFKHFYLFFLGSHSCNYSSEIWERRDGGGELLCFWVFCFFFPVSNLLVLDIHANNAEGLLLRCSSETNISSAASGAAISTKHCLMFGERKQNIEPTSSLLRIITLHFKTWCHNINWTTYFEGVISFFTKLIISRYHVVIFLISCYFTLITWDFNPFSRYHVLNAAW